MRQAVGGDQVWRISDEIDQERSDVRELIKVRDLEDWKP